MTGTNSAILKQENVHLMRQAKEEKTNQHVKQVKVELMTKKRKSTKNHCGMKTIFLGKD